MFQPKIAPEEIEGLDLIAFGGRISVITEPGAELDHAIEYLQNQRFIGFDTETKPVFQAHQPHRHTALLQLSGEEEAFLFRLHSLGLPEEIADVMADPNITKIGAAVADDIRGLQYFRKFNAQRFLDLQSFSNFYDIEDKSLKKLTAIVLGRKLSKKEQCSNWEAPILSDSQQLYAATDAWICVKLYKSLLDAEQTSEK